MGDRVYRYVMMAVAVAVFGGAARGAEWKQVEAVTDPDPRMKSPEEERGLIHMPPGYGLDLIAADPQVISPTISVWDGNGRMYVAEMRTYMLDINGRDAFVPSSRVSRWEDTDGDGVYDRHTVFADKLLLPRMILPLDDRILIRETNTKDVYSYRDTDGDGVADEKVRVYEGGVQGWNLEHQPSGLIWNVDNWIYVTHQKERFRWKGDKLVKEDIPFDHGQWGIAMDDTGRMIFHTAGNERPAHDFQVMPQYGEMDVPGELVDGFTEVFPLCRMTDVQGGPPRLKKEGGLNVFTSTAGGSIFRGDGLPHDLYGDYILPEPVGRLIRRAQVMDVNGKRILRNFYDKREFIASTDPNFRPTWTATGPDGLLYICDMYHGIIQEANWTKEGSYLRPEIQKYGLDKNIDGGRIWRLTHEVYRRRAMPRMLDESPAELVAHLADVNGWWRDTAQKLIILRGDKSVVPALKEMATKHDYPLARLHALWALEGLEAIEPPFLLERMKDADARIRWAAVRIAEPMVKKGEPAEVVAAVKGMAKDADPTVAAQVCLSMLYVGHKEADAVVKEAVAVQDRVDARDNMARLLSTRYTDRLAKMKADEEKRKQMEAANAKLAAVYERGKTYYSQTCIACHGVDGMGAPAPERNGNTLAPPLKGSKRLLGDKKVVARLVLNGLVGNVEGKVYPGQMPSFKWADDVWLSSILTYARNEWGNKAELVEEAEVAAIRKETESREKPFTLEELIPPTGEKAAAPQQKAAVPAAAVKGAEQAAGR